MELFSLQDSCRNPFFGNLVHDCHNFSQCWLFWPLYWFQSFQQSCGGPGCTDDEWKWDCHQQQKETSCGWSGWVVSPTLFFCSVPADTVWIMSIVVALSWEKWGLLGIFSSAFSIIERQTARFIICWVSTLYLNLKGDDVLVAHSTTNAEILSKETGWR